MLFWIRWETKKLLVHSDLNSIIIIIIIIN